MYLEEKCSGHSATTWKKNNFLGNSRVHFIHVTVTKGCNVIDMNPWISVAFSWSSAAHNFFSEWPSDNLPWETHKNHGQKNTWFPDDDENPKISSSLNMVHQSSHWVPHQFVNTFWVFLGDEIQPSLAGNKSISALEIPNGFFNQRLPKENRLLCSVCEAQNLHLGVSRGHVIWLQLFFKVPANRKKTHSFRHLQKFPTKKSAVRRFHKRVCTKKGLPSKNWRTHDNDFVLFEKFLFRIRDYEKTSSKIATLMWSVFVPPLPKKTNWKRSRCKVQRIILSLLWGGGWVIQNPPKVRHQTNWSMIYGKLQANLEYPISIQLWFLLVYWWGGQ